MNSGDTWKLCFHDELMLRTQITDVWNTLGALSADVTIETDTIFGAGTDDDVYLEIYDGTSLKKSVPLDKYNYNDFEMGDKDTYCVPLSDNLTDTVPLGNLNMKLTCRGNTAGGTWDVKSVDITLYHGEMQLTDAISCGPAELYNSTWDLNITNDLKRKACSCTPVTLSYVTDVDDGMLDFVYSLDGSHQYVNSDGLLWGDVAVRKEVFFKIFKGFGPGIEYVGEAKEVSEGQAFDMDFTLEGMWNGVGETRRNEVYFDPDTTPGNGDDYPEMPKVSGSATISFLDSDGNAVCSVEQAVSSGEILLRGYNNDSLTAGTYSVEVSFAPDSADPMYGAAEKVFRDKLTVTAKPPVPWMGYVITFDANGGSGTMDKVSYAVENYKLPKCLFNAPEGRTFDCWLVDGKEYAEGDLVKLKSETTTVTAKWKDVPPSHVHDLSLVEAKDPGCTEAGNTEYYACDGCDRWFEDKTGLLEITDKSSVMIDPLGHDWGSWVQTKAPTGTEEGGETRTCSRCGGKETRSIPKTDPEKPDEPPVPEVPETTAPPSIDADDHETAPEGREEEAGKNASKPGADIVRAHTRGSRSSLSYGYWSLGTDGWTYREGGTPVRGAWRFLPYNGVNYWYYFGENGIMRIGWLDWNGSRYYLYPVSDGWMGRMLTGWQLIDGKWYYFETVAGKNQGHMYRSERTPDGYYVGADGVWDGSPADAGR